jgi:two-component system, LytTR family, response regulator
LDLKKEMMMTCLVLDDEQHAIDVLQQHIADTPFLQLRLATTQAREAIDFLSKEIIDILYLDVQMPDINGLDLLNAVSGRFRHVILCSAYREYALDGFDNSVSDFLLKPVSYARFLKSAQKVFVTPAVTPHDFIFVKTGVKGKAVKVNFADLSYVESLKNYVAFHQGHDKVLTYMKISELENSLPPHDFIRIHKSFIVRLDKIAMVEGNTILLKDTAERLTIGAVYKEKLLEALGIK